MPRHPHALVHPFKLVLTDFLDDLKRNQTEGLEWEQCSQVQEVLKEVVTLFKNQSQPSDWLLELHARFESFLTEYVIWNNNEEAPSSSKHRAKHEKELRKIRAQILPEFKYGPLFATAEENDIFVQAYKAFISLGQIRHNPKQPPEGLFKKTVQRATEKQRKIA